MYPEAAERVEMTLQTTNCPRGNVLLPHPEVFTSLNPVSVTAQVCRGISAVPLPEDSRGPSLSSAPPGGMTASSAGETEAQSGGAVPPLCHQAQLQDSIWKAKRGTDLSHKTMPTT